MRYCTGGFINRMCSKLNFSVTGSVFLEYTLCTVCVLLKYFFIFKLSVYLHLSLQ